MQLCLTLVVVFALCKLSSAGRYNITCYYDTFSIKRGGFANFTELDLKTSLEYCTHIVYGYVGLRPGKFDIQTLHSRQHQQFAEVKKWKKQHRHIKFLLSLGGDKDLRNPEKYIKLLETNDRNQQYFIKSAKSFLRKYNFDGLDLSYQFPHEKPKKQSKLRGYLDKAKNKIKSNAVVKKLDAKFSKKSSKSNHEQEHKQKFTALVNNLKNAFRHDKLLLTLTVLPHVNASKYVNIPAVIEDFDFVNLGTFDYSTPARNPRSADFLAPLQAPPRHKDRLPQSYIDYDVRQWLSQHINSRKLNIGVATYGRAWKMTKELKSSIMPVTSSLAGPAQGGELTHTPGILSYPEICFRLDKMSKSKDKNFGNYAYRSANVKGHEGLFITYEDRDSLTAKAEYVERNSLGGVAIFDLTLDDFRGKCNQGNFPALKAIKFKLH